MAQGEVTGYTEEELYSLRDQHWKAPLWQQHGVPFETAFCLTRIGKQPDDYDGPTRYCSKRAAKDDEYDGHPHDEEAYHPSCRFHGGSSNGENAENLDNPLTVSITHGLFAEDEHLQMDFDDNEQALYNGIVEHWPEAYDWPDESEDPARYLILRKVATNVVRTVRAEDYLDEEGEVHLQPIFDDEGVRVADEPQENPISGEYRLLVDEILKMLKELGLTPKERSRMDKEESEGSAAEAFAEMASDALDSDGREYDPTEFGPDEGGGDDDA